MEGQVARPSVPQTWTKTLAAADLPEVGHVPSSAGLLARLPSPTPPQHTVPTLPPAEALGAVGSVPAAALPLPALR
jgi:hypothetical protein